MAPHRADRYHRSMATAPLIPSQRARDRVLAVTMLCVFLGALGAAYGLTTQRGTRPVEVIQVSIGEITFSLPITWRQAQAAESPSRPDPIRFVDTSRPSRELLLVRVESTNPMPGEALLPSIVEGLARLGGAQQIQAVALQVRRRGDLVITQWLGVTPAPAGHQEHPQATAVHLAANLTREGRVHWILFLTDRSATNEAAEAMLRRNVTLLRHIVASADLTAPDAPDAPPDSTVPRP